MLHTKTCNDNFCTSCCAADHMAIELKPCNTMARVFAQLCTEKQVESFWLAFKKSHGGVQFFAQQCCTKISSLRVVLCGKSAKRSSKYLSTHDWNRKLLEVWFRDFYFHDRTDDIAFDEFEKKRIHKINYAMLEAKTGLLHKKFHCIK